MSSNVVLTDDFVTKFERLRDDIVAGRHPEYRLPPDAITALSRLSFSDTPQDLTHPLPLIIDNPQNLQPAAPVPQQHALPHLSAQNAAITIPPPYAPYANHHTSNPVAGTGAAAFDPSLLTKSDTLIREEFRLKRSRLEQVLRDKKKKPPGRPLPADAERESQIYDGPNTIDASKVLAHVEQTVPFVSGFAPVKIRETNEQKSPARSDANADDDNDVDSYYSSQAMSWTPEHIRSKTLVGDGQVSAEKDKLSGTQPARQPHVEAAGRGDERRRSSGSDLASDEDESTSREDSYSPPPATVGHHSQTAADSLRRNGFNSRSQHLSGPPVGPIDSSPHAASGQRSIVGRERESESPYSPPPADVEIITGHETSHNLQARAEGFDSAHADPPASFPHGAQGVLSQRQLKKMEMRKRREAREKARKEQINNGEQGRKRKRKSNANERPEVDETTSGREAALARLAAADPAPSSSKRHQRHDDDDRSDVQLIAQQPRSARRNKKSTKASNASPMPHIKAEPVSPGPLQVPLSVDSDTPRRLVRKRDGNFAMYLAAPPAVPTAGLQTPNQSLQTHQAPLTAAATVPFSAPVPAPPPLLPPQLERQSSNLPYNGAPPANAPPQSVRPSQLLAQRQIEAALKSLEAEQRHGLYRGDGLGSSIGNSGGVSRVDSGASSVQPSQTQAFQTFPPVQQVRRTHSYNSLSGVSPASREDAFYDDSIRWVSAPSRAPSRVIYDRPPPRRRYIEIIDDDMDDEIYDTAPPPGYRVISQPSPAYRAFEANYGEVAAVDRRSSMMPPPSLGSIPPSRKRRLFLEEDGEEWVAVPASSLGMRRSVARDVQQPEEYARAPSRQTMDRPLRSIEDRRMYQESGIEAYDERRPGRDYASSQVSSAVPSRRRHMIDVDVEGAFDVPQARPTAVPRQRLMSELPREPVSRREGENLRRRLEVRQGYEDEEYEPAPLRQLARMPSRAMSMQAPSDLYGEHQPVHYMQSLPSSGRHPRWQREEAGLNSPASLPQQGQQDRDYFDPSRMPPPPLPPIPLAPTTRHESLMRAPQSQASGPTRGGSNNNLYPQQAYQNMPNSGTDNYGDTEYDPRNARMSFY